MNWYKKSQLAATPFSEGTVYTDYGHDIQSRCPVYIWDISYGRLRSQKVTKAFYDRYKKEHGGIAPTHRELFGIESNSTARGRYDSCTGESSITLFWEHLGQDDIDEIHELLINAFGNIKLRGIPKHVQKMRQSTLTV